MRGKVSIYINHLHNEQEKNEDILVNQTTQSSPCSPNELDASENLNSFIINTSNIRKNLGNYITSLGLLNILN